MTENNRELTPEWRALADALRGMHDDIDGGHIELNAFAEQFFAMAQAYHRAILSSGKTSMRIRAMLKALDLGTGRNELLDFVGGQPRFPIV